ncbi:MAG: aldehyde ferredoxin oxidoreductase family protein [Nitrospirota bacterium]|nr:aldehyde ferredoxin oxidoreductase family protein [Nitrospirota bacterium]
MYGYTSKTLRVDLRLKKTEIISTPTGLNKKFMGGRGFGVALLGKRILNEFDSPDMPLIFSSGPLVGTAAPTSGRSSVISRSPLTGTVMDCSVGGKFGTALKKAGFDCIEIVGIADSGVTLTIENGRATVEDAERLTGKNVEEVRKLIGGKGSDAVIGIAGEKGVKFASIVFDGHYLAGRGGLGAVMGAKRIKAIKVKGDGAVPVYDREELQKAREEIMRLLRASQAVFGELGLSEFGTSAFVDLIHSRRMEPTDNFRATFYDFASSYSGYRLKNRYKTKKTGCAGCPVLCKKVGERGEIIPEYETVSHFGALNGNNDVESIIEANRLCNDFGMDTISTASTLSCYAELEGAVPGPDEMLALIKKIAMREKGPGEALAEGSYRYAQLQGRQQLSMSVKGLELPAYDPRGAYGMALAYATSNRGGCHLRAYPISHEILRKPVATDRFSFEGKARIIKIAEDMNAVVDSITACKFVFFAASLEEYAKAVSAVTGMDHDAQSLLKTGERIYVLERHLNSLNGFDINDDDLPERFFAEEGSSSPNIQVKPLDREEFLAARNNYYRARGYGQNGVPDSDLLVSLGLGEYL